MTTARHIEVQSRTGRVKGIVAAFVVALLAISGVSLGAGAANAATGTVIRPSISTVFDGAVIPNSLDDSNSNGIVSSNDAAGFTWDFASSGLTDGTFSQTLPAGWTWNTASLSSLTSNSSIYTSSYVISADGLTLTATVSVPAGSETLVSLGTLTATPTGAAANGSVYTPTLVVTDEAAATTLTTSPITVANEPRADVAKSLSTNNVRSTRDFGSGPEEARYIDYNLVVQKPIGTALIGAADTELQQPLVLSDTFSFTAPLPPTGAPSTTQVEIVAQTQAGTAALTGTNPFSVTIDGATNLGTTQYVVVVRMWFKASEIPDATQGSLKVDNAVAAPGMTSTGGIPITDDESNNNATGGFVQLPIPDGSGFAYNKDIYVANNPNAPVWNTNPAGSSFTYVTDGSVAPGATVFARPHLKAQYVDGTSAGMTNLVAYDFWNPAEQQIISEHGYYLGDNNGNALPTSDYVVTYTTGTDNSNPLAMTWYPTVAAAGGAAAVTGVSFAYTGAPVYGAGTADIWFMPAIPFKVVANGGTTITDVGRWTSDEITRLGATPNVTRTVIVQESVVSVVERTDVSAVVSGGAINYTLTPKVAGAPGSDPAIEVKVAGMTVVEHVSPSLVSLDLSGLSPDWTVVVTPGDFGPDGIAGTADDISGTTLTFTYVGNGGIASSLTAPAPITYKATTSVQAPASGNVTNRATVSATGNTQSVPARSTSSTVAVTQANVITKTKTTPKPVIEVGDPTAEWTSTWFNYQTTPQGRSVFVDVLPYNGDARGTSFNGTATLQSATLVGADLSGLTLEYTTDAPATIAPAPSASTTWTTTAPADLSTVTAVRVEITNLTSGASGVGGVKVVLALDGQEAGDVYANTVSGQLDLDNPDSDAVFTDGVPTKVTVVDSSITGTVWNDANGDGIRDAGDDLGIAGVTVGLFQADGTTPVLAADGVTPVTTTTAADGSYTFAALHSGSYQVRATPPALSGAGVMANTYDLDGNHDSVSGVIAVGVDNDTAVADFGYLALTASISVVKTHTALTGTPAVGDVITWSFLVTNTGTAPLTGVALTDALLGATGTPAVTADGTLAAGASVTVTAPYTITQGDLNAGSVVNTVSVEGTYAPGLTVTDESVDTVPLAANGALELTKTATVAVSGEVAAAGDVVTFVVTGTNTGNVELHDVVVTDLKAGLIAGTTVFSGGVDGILAPGDTVTVTSTYVLTQADLDQGFVDNVATIDGLTPANAPVTNEASVEVDLDSLLAVSLTKLYTPSTGSQNFAGDVLSFSLSATNGSNVTLHNVTITDHLDGASAPVYTWPGAEGVLAPGETVTAVVTYTLTQADVDAGEIENTATVDGLSPADVPVTADAAVTVPIASAGEISLVKTGTVTGTGTNSQVAFTLVATNTGNVTLHGVALTDELEGLSSLVYTWPGEEGVLAPGEAVTATATYTATAADVAAGKVVNDASVDGLTPASDAVTAEATVTVVIAPAPTLLAMTGSEPFAAALLALLLLIAGAAVLVASKRRRTV